MTLNPDNIQTLDDNDCDGDKGLARFCTTTVDVTYETDCETSTTIYKKSTYNSKKSKMVKVKDGKTTDTWATCSSYPRSVTKTCCNNVYQTPAAPEKVYTTVDPSDNDSYNDECEPSSNDMFYEGPIAFQYPDGQIQLYNKGLVDEDDGQLRYVCHNSQAVMMSIIDGIMYDEQGRIGSIVSNSQLQFDGPPPQAGTKYALGWSITNNFFLALGDQTVFYECPQDDQYKVYGDKLYDSCTEVMIKVAGVLHDCYVEQDEECT
ncbi:unnamed protein product [Ambrosiozyma monospora]|uniref:Unnamed protein product n=1 Tax=Ambrosiozyma monospora TaxID=43982 RepID=A0ACB5U778_AMBMO|nr:unnamed protein product [Ambrosiozyma monospora]